MAFMRRLVSPITVLSLALLALPAFVAGCAGRAYFATPTATPPFLINTVLVTGPASPDGTQAILGTSDLDVGRNRVGFVLQTPKELVHVPEVTVTSVFSPGTNGQEGETAAAAFHLWPYGTRGMYVTEMTFDRPGRWGLNISIPADGRNGPRSASIAFEVREDAFTPDVGEDAPRTATKTVRDVADPRHLSTAFKVDADLYQVSLDEAVQNGKPTVVVFTSPAYCTNAVCGPQDEVLSALKDAYKAQANFVHVDIYDNPEEIQGDLRRARITPAVEVWGLHSIEWTFVIGKDGKIAKKFEAFATYEEVEEALKGVL